MTRDPLESFRNEVVTALEHALERRGWLDAVEDVDGSLEEPPEHLGDLAYPCFPLAPTARKAPPEIARELEGALPRLEQVDAQAEGPYLNFRFHDRPLLERTLEAVMWWGRDYGTQPEKGTSVIVEHTSANPNGPFHVGRARNPVVGDGLARVLRAGGYDVTAEYYVNDMGRQVALLTWGLEHLTEEDVPEADRDKPDHQLVGTYQRAHELAEADPDVKAEVDAILRALEEGDEDAAERVRDAADRVLEGMRESLQRMHVHLDNWAWESTYVRDGSVQEVVETLRARDEAERDEGDAWFIDMEPWGLQGKDTRWFFTRTDGTTLYTTRDLAYHREKFQRADLALNVLGEDHKLTMDQLNVALGLLDVDHEPEVVWISFVNLPEGKMSTRRGRVVYLDDLLDEAVDRAYAEVEARRSDELSPQEMQEIAEAVGVGAVRFNISRVQPEKGITFRWEEALNFEGSSAPFCQYAHARAAGILQRAEQSAEPDLSRLGHKSERALVRTLATFPTLVERCAAERKVHPVAGYAVEVANAFNAFYRDCPVAQAGDGLREARLELVRAAKQVLANALELLGVEAPDSM